MIKNYRKKPVVIRAVLWTGENLLQVVRFMGQEVNMECSVTSEKWHLYTNIVHSNGLKISTLEGEMNADIGDYIIKGVKGEYYPCKPDVFELTYEDA